VIDDNQTDDGIEVLGREEDEEQWLSDIKRAQKLVIEIAKDHLVSRDAKHMIKAPKEISAFETGEYVLIEQGSSFRRGPADKLLPFLAGPYVVTDVQGSEYTLRNCITLRSKRVHLGKLYPYTVSEFHRSPAEAASRDFGDVFMVDRIVAADTSNDTKGAVSALKFKVAWVGFPGEDTTEPWKELKILIQFRHFLSNHADKGYRDLVKKLPRNSHTEIYYMLHESY
jgi:hypothetical protein